MKRVLLFTLLAVAAHAQDPLVNSIQCANVHACTTSWGVTKGNLLVVGGWYGTSGGGSITDSQGNPYVLLRNTQTYGSASWLQVTAASDSGAITVSFPAAQDHVVIAEFTGYNTTVLTSADTPWSHGAQCPDVPMSMPLAAPALVLSVWSMDAENLTGCGLSSGNVLGATCGGQSGGINYSVAPVGTVTQQLTVSPGYNSGDSNCGIYALAAIPVITPPLAGVPWWPCASAFGDGTAAFLKGAYKTVGCLNDTGTPLTISAVRCYSDNAGTSTLDVLNGAGQSLLAAPVICSPSWGRGSMGAVTTLGPDDWLTYVFTSDGNTLASTFNVTTRR